MNIIDCLKEHLSQAFPDGLIEIRDPRRDGHHLEVTITSALFSEKDRVTRHRMVYDALGELLTKGTIHALSIQTRLPQT